MNNSDQLRYDYVEIASKYKCFRIYYRDELGSYRFWGSIPSEDAIEVPAALDCFCRPDAAGYMVIGDTGYGDEVLDCGDTIDNGYHKVINSKKKGKSRVLRKYL